MAWAKHVPKNYKVTLQWTSQDCTKLNKYHHHHLDHQSNQRRENTAFIILFFAILRELLSKGLQVFNILMVA